MIIESPQFVKRPLVSVYILTYNQQTTIAQTIESVLMQECDFDYELIIGEDFSRDNTREIIVKYQEKYPKVIKLLLQESNQGLVKNYIDGIRLCQGKYIAQCAGDDYWIDKLKLSKQVNFLENNPEYGLVSTGGYKLFVKSNKFVEGIAPLHPVVDGDVFHETYKGGVYAMPLSVMFRNELLKHMDFDQFILRKFSCEDVPLQAILAKHSKFGHIPDLTCVYRVYGNSMTNTAVSDPHFLAYHEGLLSMKRYLAELFPGETDFTEEWANDYLAFKRVRLAIYNFDYKSARKHLSELNQIGTHERRIILLTKSKLVFYVACMGRRIKYLYSKLTSGI